MAGTEYAKSCSVKFDPVPAVGKGVALQPLVEKLKFIVYKDGWAGYLRRSVVEIKYEDFELLASELSQRLLRSEPSGP